MGIIFANKDVIQKIMKTELKTNYACVGVPINQLLSKPVSDHPDMSLYVGKSIFVSPEIYDLTLNELKYSDDTRWAVKYLNKGLSLQNAVYPQNIAFNAVLLNGLLFHLIDHTEPLVLKEVEESNDIKINVKQGYTKCSTLIVDHKSVITEDTNLHKHYLENGIDSLLVSKGHVQLKGYSYGFIGGCGGKVENTLLINGSFKYHPECDKIEKFVKSKQIEILELMDSPLVDCGSILCFEKP